MSVNLEELRVGDTIQLRDGTRHVVTVADGPDCDGDFWIETVSARIGHFPTDPSDAWNHKACGMWSGGDNDSPGDIVRILPAAVSTNSKIALMQRMIDEGFITSYEAKRLMVEPATAGGIKHDLDKPALALLPFRATEEVAKVLAFGATKYDAWNWKKGFAWSRLISAALRHLFAFARGEDNDAETGLSHLAHAACCVLFLLDHKLEEYGTDDRHKPK